MADYFTRTRTILHHEWVLPNPTNNAEYEKAINNAINWATNNGVIIHDNTLQIRATDTHIIIFIEGEISEV